MNVYFDVKNILYMLPLVTVDNMMELYTITRNSIRAYYGVVMNVSARETLNDVEM